MIARRASDGSSRSSRGFLSLGALLVLAVVVTACAKPTKPEGISDSPQHHYAIGMKQLETGDAARARQEFERARALDPKFAPAYEGLGLVALAEKDYKSAESLLEESRKRDDKYVPAHLGLAKLHAEKGDLNKAKSHAETARRLAPNNARVHIALGQVLLRAYDFNGAEASFAKALELEPTSTEARREWDRTVKIRQASPGTAVGRRIALADPITRGELAALLATELNIETQLRKRRPELFDPSFRPPTSPPAGPAASAAPVASEVTDTTGHWARNAVDLVVKLNLMDPYPDRTFRPDEPVTRASLARTLEQVLVVAANDPALRTRYLGQTSPFPDVRSDHFAFNSAVVVTTRGLMEAERPSGAFRLVTPVSGPDALLAMRKLAELF
jgi:Tfp pilus assembly protein PilF